MKLLERFFEDRATTFQQVWGADLDNPASPFSPVAASRDKVLGLSAVFACVRLITDTISTLPFHAFEDSGINHVQSVQQPEWIDRPVPRDPSITRQVHMQQVITSLLLDGNAFILAAPNIFQPAEVRVLDPRKVEILRQKDSSVVYRIRDEQGGLFETDWTQIVHIPLIRLAGELRGVSPLEAERQVFAAAISTDELGYRFLRNGVWIAGTIEAPQGAVFTKEQAEEIKSQFVDRYSGTRNAGKVGLLTGGAKYTPLSVTPEQAQFLATMQYSDERIFRIYRCPPAMVGMTVPGATSHGSGDMQAISFEKHTVRPLTDVLEGSYEALCAPGQYVRFNTKGLLRGDPKTQAELYHYGLTDKWLKVDEVRSLEELDPLGGKDGGLLETPNNNAPGQTPPTDPSATPAQDPAADTQPRSVVNVTSPAVNVHSAPITVNPPSVTVTMPGEKRALTRSVIEWTEVDGRRYATGSHDELIEEPDAA